MKTKLSTTGYLDNSPDRFSESILVPSNSTTMEGVTGKSVLMIPVSANKVGNPVLAKPGENYYFPDYAAVLEMAMPLQARMDFDRFAKGGPINMSIPAIIEVLQTGYVKGRSLTDAQRLRFAQKAGTNLFGEYEEEEEEDLERDYSKRGGPTKGLKKGRYTNKNIQSSINETLYRRNETLYGPSGKRYYKPYKKGGWLDELPMAQKGTQVEDNDSWLENIAEIVDPSGISSWDDVYRAYQNTGLSGETALEVLGALPFLGKVAKVTKPGIHLTKYSGVDKVLKNTLPKNKSLSRVSNAASKIGRGTDAVQSVLGSKDKSGFTWDMTHGEVPMYNGRNIFPQIQLGERGDFKTGGWLNSYDTGGTTEKPKEKTETSFSENLLDRYSKIQEQLEEERRRVSGVRKNVIPAAQALDKADSELPIKYPEAYKIFQESRSAQTPEELKRLIKKYPDVLKNVLPDAGNYNLLLSNPNKYTASDELYCTPYGCLTYQKAGAPDVPIISGNFGFVEGAKKGTLPFKEVPAEEAEPGDMAIVYGKTVLDYRDPSKGVGNRPHHTTVLADKPRLDPKGNVKGFYMYNAEEGNRLAYGKSYRRPNDPSRKDKDTGYKFYRYTGKLPQYEEQLGELRSQLATMPMESLPVNQYLASSPEEPTLMLKQKGGWLDEYQNKGEVNFAPENWSKKYGKVAANDKPKLIAPNFPRSEQEARSRLDNEAAERTRNYLAQVEQYTKKGVPLKEAQAAVDRADRKPDTLKEYVPMSGAQKALKVAMNPVEAFKQYNKYGYVADNYSDSELYSPAGVLGLGYQALTAPGQVASLVNAGYNLPKDIAQGNWLSAVGNTLDVVPGVSGALLSNLPGKAGKLYNKVATGNSRLPVAWKMEQIADDIASVKNKYDLTDEEAIVLGKYINSPYSVTRGTEESKVLDNLIKRNKAILDNVKAPVTKVLGHSTGTDKDFVPTKFGSKFTFPGNRSWSLGVDPRFQNTNRTRLVVPSKYTKDLDFFAVPYEDDRLAEGWNIARKGLDDEAATSLKHMASEKELIGNIPAGYKIIGSSNEGGFKNIFIKPIKSKGGWLKKYE